MTFVCSCNIEWNLAKLTTKSSVLTALCPMVFGVAHAPLCGDLRLCL